MKDYFVYCMTNWTGERIYTGVTNDLERRVLEHKSGLIKGFSQKYNIKKLVYYEQFGDVGAAILREKEIKGWRREKKNTLVESMNPDWQELFEI
ncbi:MAG: GIY-YIG nuclease family protein [Bdellovibrionales bacterium]